MILKCDCKHDAQDRIHGPGRRVHNEKQGKGAQKGVYRCTVCKKEKGSAESKP